MRDFFVNEFTIIRLTNSKKRVYTKKWNPNNVDDIRSGIHGTQLNGNLVIKNMFFHLIEEEEFYDRFIVDVLEIP